MGKIKGWKRENKLDFGGVVHDEVYVTNSKKGNKFPIPAQTVKVFGDNSFGAIHIVKAEQALDDNNYYNVFIGKFDDVEGNGFESFKKAKSYAVKYMKDNPDGNKAKR